MINANMRMILANESAICRIALQQVANSGHINMCEIGRAIGIRFHGGQYAALRGYFCELGLEANLTPFRPRARRAIPPQQVSYEPALV